MSENSDKKFDELFGLPEAPHHDITVPKRSIPPVVVKKEEPKNFAEEVENDSEMVKEKLKSVLAKAEDAFDALIHLSKSDENIGGYNVANAMLKNIKEIAATIMDVNVAKSNISVNMKKNKIMDETGKDPDTPKLANNKTVNNTIVFTGTTADLQHMINNRIKNDGGDIIDGE